MKYKDELCYDVGDQLADLPESQLRQYNTCAMIVAELQMANKELNRIRIDNIADEQERWNEYNTQCCEDFESYISRRCKYYIDKMDALLKKIDMGR